MALTKCPECSKEISSQAVSCPHCGFPLGTTPKESAQIEQPNTEAMPKSTPASPSPKPTPGSGCRGCLSVILLIFGITCIGAGIFGYTVQKETGKATVITRGWLRAAIEKKPEFEVKKHYADAPADSDHRAIHTIFGIACVGGGLWILRKKFRVLSGKPYNPLKIVSSNGGSGGDAEDAK